MSEVTKVKMLEYMGRVFLCYDSVIDRQVYEAIVRLIESAGVKHSGEQPLATYRLRPEVAAFAAIMEAELRKHDDRPGWKECDPHWLLARLKEEVMELANALLDHAESIPQEAADVANFCLMIADVEGGLKASGEQPAPPPVKVSRRRLAKYCEHEGDFYDLVDYLREQGIDVAEEEGE